MLFCKLSTCSLIVSPEKSYNELNYHAPGCDGDSRNPDSKPFSAEEFMGTWRQCEKLAEEGKVRYLGMSNMTVPKLEAVLPLCRIQPGQIPIPFSVKEPQYVSNLRCITEDPLTAEEMEWIRKADRNCRLIKGQVFLWPGAKGWEDLWDMEGMITC